MDRMTELIRVPSTLIPLSELALELATPTTGWLIELDRRGIPVQADDIGRDSITRADARQLLNEQRENEARQARMREETERQAIEQDQQWRATLNPGVPWYVVGRDISPAAAMLEASQDADYAGRPRSLQSELLEAELGGKGNTMEYHSIREEEDAAAAGMVG